MKRRDFFIQAGVGSVALGSLDRLSKPLHAKPAARGMKTAQADPNMRAIFFNNLALIIAEPQLPVSIDGTAQVSGHPWYESRIFAIPPDGPPPNLNPKIEVNSSIRPRDFLRPPGRIIPSPFESAAFRFRPRSGRFNYASQWPSVSTPSDARNTVVLALVNRGASILFNTNFDLAYSVDGEIIDGPSGTQRATIELTPRKANLSVIIRLRSSSTDEAAVTMLAETADPPPSSRTPGSIIWNLANPTVDETRTFTAQVAVKNLAHPRQLHHIPDLLITASQAVEIVGTETASEVEFPSEFLPAKIESVRYSLSDEVTWRFERADRTLVDIREVTELVA